MRHAFIGLAVAAVLALSLSGATLFGIAVWKFVAAAAGVALIARGGRSLT